MKRWNYFARPIPKNVTFVPYYEKNRYDISVLDVDQQCIDPRIGKGKLYRALNEEIQDIPKIVINHGSPCWPENWESSGHKRWNYPLGFDDNDRKKVLEYQAKFLIEGGKTILNGETVEIEGMEKLIGKNKMVVNSFKAREQWGWGKVIWHGLDPDEWWDLPKEPRSVTMISMAGLDYYYGRDFLNSTIARCNEDYGIRHTWISHPGSWIIHDSNIFSQRGGFDAYRDYLGRSMIYFNPTRESPMPRSRTEAFLCLKPDSKIILGNDFSIREIKDIEIGDIVIDRNGKKVKVNETYSKYFKGGFRKITIYGHQPIECSKEHKFLAIKTSKFINKYGNGTICKPNTRKRDKHIKRGFNSLKAEWIEAKEIKRGDCILSPDDFEVDNQKHIKISDYVNGDKIVNRDGYIRWKGCFNNLPDICKKCLGKNRYPGKKSQGFLTYLQGSGYKDIGFYKDNIRITPELARFVGYYIAEGYVLGSTIRLCFGSSETEYHNDVIELVKGLFGIDSKTVERRNNKTEIVFSNKLIAKFLENSCGKGAINKMIPRELVNSDEKVIINLLAGLYRGDGHIGNEASYCSISKKLVYQIYFLLKRLRLHGSVTMNKAHGNRMRFDSYLVRSYGTYRDVVKDIVNELKFINEKHKGHSYFRHNGNWYFMVNKIEKYKYEGMVYDLNVEGNNYLVNGLITHNSGCCVLTTAYHDATKFVNFDTRDLWANSEGTKEFTDKIEMYIDEPSINGFVIPENPLAVASLIYYLIFENPRAALRIGQKGKETARKLFSKSVFDANWTKLLQETIQKYRRNVSII